MKISKSASISTRIDPAVRSAFHKKAKNEPGHDVSSVLRELIAMYVNNLVQLPKEKS